MEDREEESKRMKGDQRKMRGAEKEERRRMRDEEKKRQSKCKAEEGAAPSKTKPNVKGLGSSESDSDLESLSTGVFF